MKWYIQHIKKEHSELQEILRLLSIAGQAVVEVGLKDGELFDVSQQKIIQKEESACVFLGSYTLGRLFQKINSSAIFDLDGYSYKDWSDIFGKEHVLNADAFIGNSGDIPWSGSSMFVRPLHDDKAFNGGVFEKSTFNYDGLVVASNVKSIFSEARCFVVDGRVVTSSVYKINGDYHVSSIVDQGVIEFAQSLCTKFTHPGFSIDIASTPEGLKIVELNCLNYSGFYNANLAKLIDALLLHYGE